MNLVAIDPGTHTSAGAGFDRNVLVAVWVDSIWGFWLDRYADQAVCEIPQVYRGRGQKGDPNDLIGLALVAGQLMGRYHTDWRLVRPHEWKGSVPKKIHQKRILGLLSPDEFGIVQRCNCTMKQKIDIIDAVGIGLWALGRGSK